MTAQAGGASPLLPRVLMQARRRKHADERRRLRRLRRELPADVRRDAERRIAATLRRLGLAAPGRVVAVYLAMDGEVDLAPYFRMARRNGARLYAPRIIHRRRRAIRFLPLADDATLARNRFGIAEPADVPARGVPPRRIDAVIAPLVGFDPRGYRLGMGGGYYDRALRARLAGRRAWRRPRIIGVAFACQEVRGYEVAPWDVPLDLIVTERGVLRPARPVPDHEGSMQ